MENNYTYKKKNTGVGYILQENMISVFFFLQKNSSLIQCVNWSFFVINCETYYQFLSETVSTPIFFRLQKLILTIEITFLNYIFRFSGIPYVVYS